MMKNMSQGVKGDEVDIPVACPITILMASQRILELVW